MTTQMTSTGITFPDSTTQTTAAGASVPSGSVMLFFQASAPTGWTQYTTLNDYAIRVVSGTGGGTGGSSGFSTAFATPSVSVGGLSAAATTLSTAQIPSHSHGLPFVNVLCGGTTAINPYGASSVTAANSSFSAGGGGSHTHSISGSATTSINVQYANHILATKN